MQLVVNVQPGFLQDMLLCWQATHRWADKHPLHYTYTLTKAPCSGQTLVKYMLLCWLTNDGVKQAPCAINFILTEALCSGHATSSQDFSSTCLCTSWPLMGRNRPLALYFTLTLTNGQHLQAPALQRFPNSLRSGRRWRYLTNRQKNTRRGSVIFHQ